MEKVKFSEFFLKLLNFFLALIGLAMATYGIFLLIRWHQSSLGDSESGSSQTRKIVLGRRFLLAVHLSHSYHLPEEWFIFLLIAIGAVLFMISCCGCIGAGARHRCCLSCYSACMILLVVVELALAAFIFFDHNWKKKLPTDRTGNFRTMFDFLHREWKYIRWVALGVVVLEAIAFSLALCWLAEKQPSDYIIRDEETVAPPVPQ
ncbi:tobamovirus multiplication protein 2A-like [Tasmannia lanceolata]|uniref:tobamovirus multiplication protein 2A-like n=1 Tax=Tasmannia lanceolata TaxID=3420 RepID=UPI0040639F8F